MDKSSNPSVHPHSRGAYFQNMHYSGSTNSVHPHSRGAYDSKKDIWNGGKVHPHSRGAYIRSRVRTGASFRFIPTRVGHTIMMSFYLSNIYGSSPLAWGIRISSINPQNTSTGSSPLAWGILCRFRESGRRRGGSSPLAWGIPIINFEKKPGRAVHPHSRGAYLLAIPAKLSPIRFIPTRVGHTPARNARSRTVPGSSPLAWGIRQ